MLHNYPNIENIKIAHELIKPFIHRTPVLKSNLINEIAGCEIYFKCENFQKVGAFKFRGATHAILTLSEDEKRNGVATHSSGNHAAALALAARMNGIKAYIVMPNNSPEVKKKAVAGYGAEITYCQPTLAARESTLETIVNKTGATMVHPYNNYKVICGQGTAAIELLEEKPYLDVVVAPVGGGGLLSGTAIASKGVNSNIKVIAAEPEYANDAYQSFKQKKFVPSLKPNTIADGLLTSLGDKTFEIILDKVDDIYTVSEVQIIEAMRLIWERMKIIIEPSSAVALAGVLANKDFFKNKKVGIIISGGNVELSKLGDLFK
ncbi:MAG: serine dehydratase [Bacteroidetes bacterium GWF2_33_38]|nr:MAG: serine dehydratase [Bacteroidetes bacterium GWF2_33_38]OFY74286.1 MAG: serine dehydratase [Bacteroidetes bacterium RIFOXYA12_FULL_33_9]OFY87537.1 MAG: serine dehydratase [Bacteroidetes bacterium RIFOXYA2_FULL_33_7]